MHKTLTLIRHAKASFSNTRSDHQRALSELGRQQVEQASRELQLRMLSFELIFCSDALRTKQTAELLHQQMQHSSLRYRDDLYLASMDTLLKYINAVPNQYQHVAVIGHNPGLSDLWCHLTGQHSASLATCAIVRLTLSCDDWRAVDYASTVKSEYIRV